MNDKKVVSFRAPGPFSREAKKRWNKIPKWAQSKLLENVWCVECRVAVSIILETADMQGEDVLLKGKCQICGNEVCRLVEPEAD